MAKKKTILERMEANPKGDWSISNIETLCTQVGLTFLPPTHGSHYKVASNILHGVVIVPYKRPIKAFYIKELVKFSKAHLATQERKGE